MRTSSNLARHFSSFTSDVRSLQKEFAKSPHSNIIYKNKKGLIDSSETVTFKSPSWNYNPMQFCVDFYDKQYYYPVILVVNNIGSIYEFTQQNLNNQIIAPKLSVIISLLSFDKE